MKYIVQKWNRNDDGYLFGIQRLQEMLFHYSDDIVKVPIHNTQTLLEEYINTEKNVIKGSVGQYQLDTIAKEIKESLSNDLIVHNIYKSEIVEEMIRFIEQDQKKAIQYIYNKIPKEKYYNACCKYLKESMTKSNCKSEIEKGLRSWLSFIIWNGYSPEYIYRFLWNSFEKEINNPQEAVVKFFDRFNFKKISYKVYFVFYEKLKPYQELMQERLHISFEDDGFFGQIKKKQKSFIGCMSVDSYDNYGAMRQAYNTLEIFMRFFCYFLNDNNSMMGKNGLVVCQDNQEGIILPIKSFGYKNIKPGPKENFNGAIDTIVLGCQNKKKDTYFELKKIVDLHNAALNQQDLNDAFLNLWSALEVASIKDGTKSKIECVTDSVAPILQNDYFESIFISILNDLRSNLGNRETQSLLDEIIEFDEEPHKVAGFIFLEKYENLREEYFKNQLKHFSNIRHKIYTMYELRKDKKSLWKLSEKYNQRVTWHLYRLYALRNAIVHAGESHKRIQMLGEHLHIYVDRVTTELMVKLASDECLTTMQDVLIDTQLLLVRKKKSFKEIGVVDEEVINLILEDYFIEELNI